MTPRCKHDDGAAKVYSGQINLSRRFAWICRICGEHGWSEDYELSQVNLDEYQRLRAAHGWGAPPRLRRLPPARVPRASGACSMPSIPPPPRLPTNLGAGASARRRFFTVMLVKSAALFALGVVSAVPWGKLGPLFPTWVSLSVTALALFNVSAVYLLWRKDG